MDFPAEIPFARLLGFELLRFDGGEAEVACGVRSELCNSMGGAHGGVTMALLDVAMVHAARSPSKGEITPLRRCTTIEMKTAFMRPGKGRLLAKGKVLHRTSSIAFCEASVFDDEGHLTAHATGTFKYLAQS